MFEVAGEHPSHGLHTSPSLIRLLLYAQCYTLKNDKNLTVFIFWGEKLVKLQRKKKNSLLLALNAQEDRRGHMNEKMSRRICCKWSGWGRSGWHREYRSWANRVLQKKMAQPLLLDCCYRAVSLHYVHLCACVRMRACVCVCACVHACVKSLLDIQIFCSCRPLLPRLLVFFCEGNSSHNFAPTFQNTIPIKAKLHPLSSYSHWSHSTNLTSDLTHIPDAWRSDRTHRRLSAHLLPSASFTIVITQSSIEPLRFSILLHREYLSTLYPQLWTPWYG